MNDWELLGIAIVGGAAVYLALGNNQIKKGISRFIPQISEIPSYTPVSTTAPRPPVAPSRGCPPGYYEDYTDGILHCHDPHGTRELDTNVKRLEPQTQWAYGVVDNNYWGYADPLNIKRPQYRPITGETLGFALTPAQQEIKRLPSLETILPPSQADIKKTQDKNKKKKHNKKLAEIPQKPGEMHTQIECSDSLPCGSNCWKGGKLYKIVCSEKERDELFPPKKTPTKKKRTPLVIPPNFPNQVTVDPYPEDVGGTTPGQDVSSTDPEWNPPEDNTSGIVTTPPTQLPTRQPEIGPITKEPTRQPQIGPTTPITGGSTIYPAIKHYTNFTGSEDGRGQLIGPEGVNQDITYKSNHKHVVSHRVNIANVPEQNLEATVYLTWPPIEAKGKDTHCVGSGGEGHAELALKFWGPRHHDSKDCCYCYASAVPSLDGKTLKLGFGGEGNHPDTDTIHKESPVKIIQLRANQFMGIKGMIWKNGDMIHQEIWCDENGAGQWVKATQWDHPNCGAKGHYDTKPATVDGGAMFEFRIDCSNVRFSGTDLAVIQPPRTGFGYAGPEGYILD